MEKEEIEKIDNKLFGKRVKIYFKEPIQKGVGFKDEKRIFHSDSVVELTYHGYDEETNNISDDNIGYHIDDIDRIEYVRDAKDDEMGAIRAVGKEEIEEEHIKEDFFMNEDKCCLCNLQKADCCKNFSELHNDIREELIKSFCKKRGIEERESVLIKKYQNVLICSACYGMNNKMKNPPCKG